MKQIKAVIGSNFGDEGKGQTTNYLASLDPKHTLNIKHNGGAQAGHTARERSVRHIYHQFGSATMQHVPTYLTEDFIVNPTRFQEEYLSLFSHTYVKIYVSANCFVTTPYDMLINQLIEQKRGNARHGSCGLGINETMQRSEQEKYRITVKDLEDTHHVYTILSSIKNEYLFSRLEALGIKKAEIDHEKLAVLEDIYLITRFFDYIKFFLANVNIISDYAPLSSYSTLLFEGAQGLLLDRNSPYFPHVTNSNTGITNVLEEIDRMQLTYDTFDIYYITRCYMTRHGAGPFATEVPNKPYSNIVDLTNIPNEFQGTIRYGILDLDLLLDSIRKDYIKAFSYQASINIVITCLDQLDAVSYYYYQHKKIAVSKDEFLNQIVSILKNEIPLIKKIYVSQGDTRYDVSVYTQK